MSDDRTAVTIKEFRSMVRKGDYDPFLLSQIFARPVSVYISWLAVRLGVSSNTITLISGAFALSGSVVLLWPSSTTLLLSVIFMQLFFLLDHADGEVARYQNLVSPGWVDDRSGSYFDRMIHYYQSPSFFFCLGAGLAVQEDVILWALLGMLAAIGASGIPRFTASYEMLMTVLRRNDSHARDLAMTIGDYYSLYVTPGAEGVRPFYIIPRNIRELLAAAKQYVWFPGYMFVYAVVVLVAISPVGGSIWVKGFLVFYSVVLTGNTVYASTRYFRLLKGLPKADILASELPEKVGAQAG